MQGMYIWVPPPAYEDYCKVTLLHQTPKMEIRSPSKFHDSNYLKINNQNSHLFYHIKESQWLPSKQNLPYNIIENTRISFKKMTQHKEWLPLI